MRRRHREARRILRCFRHPLLGIPDISGDVAPGPGLAIVGSMDHDIGERAFRLALSIVTMRDDPWFREMVRREVLHQLVRAGTSVGSNLSEASAAQTKPDFIAKTSIAKKEIFETQFWLRLGAESRVLTTLESSPLRTEAATVGRIVSTIVRNAKSNDSRGRPPAQQGAEQLLGRHRRTPLRRIHAGDRRRELLQDLVGHLPNRAPRASDWRTEPV